MYNKKELELIMNTKLEDLESSIWEAVRDTGAVTIRDLVDVDHSKAHWTKKSLTEASDLLECLGLTFSRSVSDNKYIASVGAFEQRLVEAFYVECCDEAEKEFRVHPEKYEDVTKYDADGVPYVRIEGRRLNLPEDSSDESYERWLKTLPISLSYFDEDIYVLPNERKFVREK